MRPDRKSSIAAVMLIALTLVACGGNAPSLTGPSPVAAPLSVPVEAMTQAHIRSTNGWRMSSDGVDRAARAGTYTIDLGSGPRCATAMMTSVTTTSNTPTLTLTVGSRTETVTRVGELLTVCGSGPVS